MNRFLPPAIAGLTLVAGLACAPGAERPTEAADIQAINEVREREAAAYLGGNVEGMVALFAEDCVVVPPNEPTLTGHSALRSWLGSLHDQVTLSGGYTDAEVQVVGDRAIERYTARLTVTPRGDGEAVEQIVRGIHVYRRGPDGTWRITQDVWNTAAPTAGAE